MKKYIIYSVIIIVIGFVFYKKVYIPKHTFKTTNATVGNMVVNVNGVGIVGSKDIYSIGSIYGGKVLSFDVNEGDFLKKGDLIAHIDLVDLKDKIAEQEANIKKIQNDIKTLIFDKKSAYIQYTYQEDIFNKNNKLFLNASISELIFKKYETNRDTAKIAVSVLASKIASLKSQLAQIKANISGLQERLKRYTILAPIEGYVIKKLMSNYQNINPNQTLIEIVNPKDVWIETHIDTRVSGDVKIGELATIKLRSSEKKYKGIVANIKPINNDVTNEREIDVSFEHLPIPFYLSEQATVDIKIRELKNITKVPLKALSIHDEKSGVWILKDGVVSFKRLHILAYGDKYVATKDINAKELLVITNPKNITLKNGMKIYHD